MSIVVDTVYEFPALERRFHIVYVFSSLRKGPTSIRKVILVAGPMDFPGVKSEYSFAIRCSHLVDSSPQVLDSIYGILPEHLMMGETEG